MIIGCHPDPVAAREVSLTSSIVTLPSQSDFRFDCEIPPLGRDDSCIGKFR